jgi:hypothetical protein
MKKVNWSDVGFYIVAVGIILMLLFIIKWAVQTGEETKKEWKEVACPSLLSIGRSSRDTLIIMKVQPLCKDYVLENLK